MEKKQACHIQWGRLQMTGQNPIITGAALGPEQLMWVACRTSRFLVHVFQDAHLQSVWRFPSDPVYLLLNSSWQKDTPPLNERDSGNARNDITLLVGTLDGGIWQLALSSNSLDATQRPTKKRREAVSGTDKECSLDYGLRTLATRSRGEAGESFAGPGRLPALKRWFNHDGGDDSANAWINAAVGEDDARQHFSLSRLKCRWVNQGIHSQRTVTKKYSVRLVSPSDLLHTGPPVSVIAHGPNNMVAILTSSGALDIMPLDPSCPTRRISVTCSVEESSTVKRTEPTCILFASTKIQGGSSPPDGIIASINASLFKSIFGENDTAFQAVGLLQGDKMGFVHTMSLDTSLTEARSSYGVLCNLEQPIAAILVVSVDKCTSQTHQQPSHVEQFPSDVILILGQQGRAILLAGVQHELNKPTESPFLPSKKNFSWAEKSTSTAAVQLAEKCLVFHEWDLNSPIRSAFILPHGRLCYCTGSDVLYVDLFESKGSRIIKRNTGDTANNSRVATVNLQSGSQQPLFSSSDKSGWVGKLSERRIPKQKLVPHIVPVSDVVVAIVGRGVLGARGGSRPVVAVTSRGRVLGVELSDHVSSPVLNENDDHLSWKSLQSRKEERVQNLIQSISEVAGQRIAIQRHHSFLTSILQDLANSFRLAYDVCHDSERDKIGFPELSALGPLPPCKLHCSVSVSTPPIELYRLERSALGPTFSAAYGRSGTLMKVSVQLQNHSSLTLSSSWKLVVNIRGQHPDSNKISSFSTVINRGFGLPVDRCFTHDFQIRLSSTGCSPLLASVFICHLNDAHESNGECRPGGCRFGKTKTQSVNGETFGAASNASGPRRWMHSGGESWERSDRLTSDNPGLVCLPVKHFRIDLISCLETSPLPVSLKQPSVVWMKTYSAQSDARFDHSHVAGSFAGHVRVMSTSDSSHPVSNDDGKLCRKQDVEDVLQGSIGIKAAKGKELATPDAGSVCFSTERHSRCGKDRISLLFRSSSLFLGSLVREAISCRIRLSKQYQLERESCCTSCPGYALETPEMKAERSNGANKLREKMWSASAQWQQAFKLGDSELFKSSLQQTRRLVEAILAIYRARRQRDPSDGKPSA